MRGAQGGEARGVRLAPRDAILEGGEGGGAAVAEEGQRVQRRLLVVREGRVPFKQRLDRGEEVRDVDPFSRGGARRPDELVLARARLWRRSVLWHGRLELCPDHALLARVDLHQLHHVAAAALLLELLEQLRVHPLRHRVHPRGHAREPRLPLGQRLGRDALARAAPLAALVLLARGGAELLSKGGDRHLELAAHRREPRARAPRSQRRRARAVRRAAEGRASDGGGERGRRGSPLKVRHV
mmetsp:Transcript_33424/g.110541  ORF Transcript_33424/g.110541 Transcript_33424/m.110541 type:complete len:241 (-) Transcript_33424:86-808(-)